MFCYSNHDLNTALKSSIFIIYFNFLCAAGYGIEIMVRYLDKYAIQTTDVQIPTVIDKKELKVSSLEL